MAIYHFQVQDFHGSFPDEEGSELPNVEAARDRAIEGARAMLADLIISEGIFDLEGSVRVLDEKGRELLVLPYRDAIRIRGTLVP